MTAKRKTSKKNASNSRYLRRSRLSPLKLLFWLILICLAGFVFFMMYRFFFDKNFDLPSTASEIAETKESKTQEVSTELKEKEETHKETESSEPSDNKTPIQNEGTDPNTLEELTGYITSANKVGNALVIRVNINQYLSSGTCTLNLEKNGTVVEKTAAIFPTASTSSCEGFDVPTSELSEGNWKVTISLSSNGKTGTITGSTKL